ncbi:hypothetical protein R3X27_07695 [Tropicimonas sp. TH_r6]|uniref:hypothetical protein n=1 Tax=Tropicimonas sp. TH_r6 TaxID=3082085 RepID=UPI0029543B54|nr:hypothetical protein [Tropicimonas sp. TH_r6]MDV7142564.1 hypothetical protein [Tropicimonas sp. TH_r6]
MKFILPISLAFCLLHAPAYALGPDIFGLEDKEQACLFVAEAEELAELEESERFPCGPRTRSTRTFDGIDLLRDAYRADPEATLDLIERILKAGKTN